MEIRTPNTLIARQRKFILGERVMQKMHKKWVLENSHFELEIKREEMW